MATNRLGCQHSEKDNEEAVLAAIAHTEDDGVLRKAAHRWGVVPVSVLDSVKQGSRGEFSPFQT